MHIFPFVQRNPFKILKQSIAKNVRELRTELLFGLKLAYVSYPLEIVSPCAGPITQGYGKSMQPYQCHRVSARELQIAIARGRNTFER